MAWFTSLVNGIVAFFSHDEAFGVPKGTVRAVVLLLLTITICRLAVDHGEVATALIAAFGSAIGFYFGQKKTNSEANHAEPHSQPPA